MYIDIDRATVNIKKQADERILVLHQAVPVPVLDPARDDAAFNIAPVDIVILKASVPAGDRRLSDKAVDMNSVLAVIRLHQLRHDLPAIDMVNAVPEVPGAGRLELCLPADQKPEGNGRVGQNELLHERAHMGGLRHRRLQKFGSRRRIVKEVPDDHGRAVRCADRLVHARPSALDDVPSAGEVRRPLGQNLDAADRCDRGERLSAEAEGRERIEIIDRRNL